MKNITLCFMNSFRDCTVCTAFADSIFSCVGKHLAASFLREKSVQLNFRRGQDVYTEGSLVRGIYCIEFGKVKVFKTCQSRNFIIDLKGTSDILGISSLFDGGQFIDSARCLADTSVCYIPKNAFMHLLEEDKRLLSVMYKNVVKENQRLCKLLINSKCVNMLGRVSGAILEVAIKYGVDERGRLKAQLTRKDLSELAFTTTESVIRILNELKKERVISLENSSIRIMSQAKLKSLASQKD